MPSGHEKGGMKPTTLGSVLLAYSTVLLLLVLVCVILGAESKSPQTTIHPGPQVTATKGSVWPSPATISVKQQYFTVNHRQFTFKMSGLNCSTIDFAFERYRQIIKREAYVRNYRNGHNYKEDFLYSGSIDALNVRLKGACEKRPTPEMNELYDLTVQGTENTLTAATTWGILRGLETFVQLLYPALDGATLFVNATIIHDIPQFRHRGLLIDTSRHYLPLPYILLELDAMAAVKMNVLHWHIVDDQSFPYQSRKFPELSNKGAYNNVSAIYTPKEIDRIIEYGRKRGIRVVPEFDTPGHTRSWAEGRPGLVTQCYASGQPTGEFSNIDPTKTENKEFIENFFEEVATLFYDKQLHIGGDEVPNECWNSNPGVKSYMEKHGISGNYSELQSMYIRWLTETLESHGKESIAWEEVFNSEATAPPLNVIIHIWKTDPAYLLPIVVKAGYRALTSRGWYLDHLNTDWRSMYLVNPVSKNMSVTERRRVLGGEACMWGEMADATNLHSRIWPRAAAVAERLWSSWSTTAFSTAPNRLEELTCRLRRRGVPASPPNGPGFCET